MQFESSFGHRRSGNTAAPSKALTQATTAPSQQCQNPLEKQDSRWNVEFILDSPLLDDDNHIQSHITIFMTIQFMNSCPNFSHPRASRKTREEHSLGTKPDLQTILLVAKMMSVLQMILLVAKMMPVLQMIFLVWKSRAFCNSRHQTLRKTLLKRLPQLQRKHLKQGGLFLLTKVAVALRSFGCEASRSTWGSIKWFLIFKSVIRWFQETLLLCNHLCWSTWGKMIQRCGIIWVVKIIVRNFGWLKFSTKKIVDLLKAFLYFPKNGRVIEQFRDISGQFTATFPAGGSPQKVV